MNHDIPPLSPRGLSRRDEILQLALHQARSRRRRRQISRATLFLLAIGLGAAAFRQLHPTASGPELARHTPALPSPKPILLARRPAESSVTITWIKSDPNLLKKLAIHPGPVPYRRLNDDQLLQQLADANQPVGLARINGKTELLLWPATSRRDAIKSKLH